MNRSVRGLGLRKGIGRKDFFEPTIRNGLVFAWHAKGRTDRPWYSSTGIAGLDTEDVDADRKAAPLYGNVLIAGTANTLFLTPYGVLNLGNHHVYKTPKKGMISICLIISNIMVSIWSRNG